MRSTRGRSVENAPPRDDRRGSAAQAAERPCGRERPRYGARPSSHAPARFSARTPVVRVRSSSRHPCLDVGHLDRRIRRRSPGAERSMTEPILSVRDLETQFFTEDGVVHAVDGVTFDLMPGETLGIVGESGCGKSITALSLLRLVPEPGRVTGGEVLFEGRDVLKMTDEEVRELRGKDIAMIFQDPQSSL